MASDNGRKRGGLFKAGALAGGLGLGAFLGSRAGVKLPKIPDLASIFKPKGQAKLQARTAARFPSFFREKPQERSRRARFEALKSESAKVPLLGGEGILGSFLDLF